VSLLFQDTFERADGGLGGAWIQNPALTFVIITNRVTTNVSGHKWAVTPTPGSLGSALAALTIDASSTYAANLAAGVLLCEDAGATVGYLARFVFNTGGGLGVLSLWKSNGAAGGLLIQDSRYGWTGGEHVLALLKSGPILQVLLDGVVVMSCGDTTFTAGYAGFSLNGASGMFANDFSVYDADLATIQVNPAQVRAASVGNELYLIGSGTNWTPGVPGSPVFTVDAGVITDQEIDDATHARLVYAAGVNPYWVHITDPDLGKAALLGVSLVQQQGGYVALQTLSDNLAEWLNSAAAAFIRLWFNPTEILPDQNPVMTLLGTPEEGQTVFPDLTSLADALTDVLTQLTDEVEGHDTIRRRVYDTLLQATAAASGLSTWVGYPALTAADLLTPISLIRDTDLPSIAGTLSDIQTEGGYTLGSVYTWLGWLRGEGSPDLAAILTAIAAVRGEGAPDLVAILTAIAGVRGAGNPDLAAILTAIGNIPPVDLDPVLDAVAGVRGEGAPDLVGVLTSVGGVLAAVGAVATALGLIPAEVALELVASFVSVLEAVGVVGTAVGTSEAVVTEAISAAQSEVDGRLTTLQEGVTALLEAGWPVPAIPAAWPGLANVTLGDPVAITENLVVTGPMDGALCSITAVPPGTGKDDLGDESYYYRLGYFTFRSDVGYCDERQFFAWSHGLMMPKACVRPAYLYIHTKPGVSGTIQPWVVSS
jgi:hypothetical protein